MDSTATLIKTVRSRLQVGEHLAVRQIIDGDTAILLAKDYDDALLRIHLSRHASNVYQVHLPSERGNLQRLLAQFRSQKRNRPTHLHALLRGEPRQITEFRAQGIWEFRPGQVPISSWEAAVLKDFRPHHCHWGQNPTQAMISAWLDAIGCFGCSKRIEWNCEEDDVFTDVMDALAIAGLIDRRSGEQGKEAVTALNSHPVVVAKFCEIALALVRSEATRAAASEILRKGLRLHLDGIRAMRPEVEALQFAAAWFQEQATWAESSSLSESRRRL